MHIGRATHALVIAFLFGLVAGGTTTAATSFQAPESWSDICTARAPVGSELVQGTNCRWLRLDGVWRRYLVVVPSAVARHPERPAPMVIMFHGSGKDGEYGLTHLGWTPVAKKEGFILVLPTAWLYQRKGTQKRRWNTWDLLDNVDGSIRLDGYPADAPYPTRDVQFVRRIIADVKSTLNVDPRRVFISGSSHGGRFVPRVATALSSVIAAGACGQWCNVPPPGTTAERDVSLLYGVGTRDELVMRYLNALEDAHQDLIPLAWSQAGPYLAPLIDGHLAFWHLDPAPTTIRQGTIMTTVTWRTPAGKVPGGNAFRLVILDGVTHRYPITTNNRHGFSLARIAWSFFEDHPMETVAARHGR